MTMTGSELASIRKSLGLTSEEWGLALGYGRTAKSAGVSVRKLEMKHDRNIPETVARLALMLKFHGRPPHEWCVICHACELSDYW